MNRVVLVCGAGAAASVCGGAWADQATLTPSKDNTIFSETTSTLSNGAGQNTFAGSTANGDARRALIRFDLSSIPAGSTISSVTLTMSLSKAPDTGTPHTVTLKRVTRDWGEGASNAPGEEGGGATALAGDATWNCAVYNGSSCGTAWTLQGGDFAGAVSAAIPVTWNDPPPPAVENQTWGPTAQMTADVQGWLSDANANFGWIVIGDESVLATARRFNSREHPDAATRPRLVVTYTPPGAACYPNCDHSTTPPAVNTGDFTCFLQQFSAGVLLPAAQQQTHYANCDGSTIFPMVNTGDFTCFLQKYAAGCS